MIFKILEFLQGKKGMIASILGAIMSYLAVKGYLGEQEIILIGALQTAIFGATSQATHNYLKNK